MKGREHKPSLYPVWKEGSQNNLSEAEMENLRLAWEIHGKQVLETVRLKRPDVFVKVVASLI